MHDVNPDGEDAAFGEESYHPDRFKLLIRDRVKRNITQAFTGRDDIDALYRRHYRENYESWGEFVRKIGDLVTIGAENGGDEALDEVQSALHAAAPLPMSARAKTGLALDVPGLAEICQAIAREFGEHHLYEHAYERYGGRYADFRSFAAHIAEIIVAGVAEGAEKMLGQVMAALQNGQKLPQPSRYPRRLSLM